MLVGLVMMRNEFLVFNLLFMYACLFHVVCIVQESSTTTEYTAFRRRIFARPVPNQHLGNLLSNPEYSCFEQISPAPRTVELNHRTIHLNAGGSHVLVVLVAQPWMSIKASSGQGFTDQVRKAWLLVSSPQ